LPSRYFMRKTVGHPFVPFDEVSHPSVPGRSRLTDRVFREHRSRLNFIWWRCGKALIVHRAAYGEMIQALPGMIPDP
jgi:hypothetical protein